MFSRSYSSRFGGTGRLYGQSVLHLLQNSHVCVAGIGGVGSWSSEALIRSGVCSLTLIDPDDICVTNTNRQIHAQANTVGRPKTAVMAERLQQINPESAINTVDDFLNADTVYDYIDKRFDYVLDATDDFRAKAAIIACCKRQKIPVITVGAAGGKNDPGRIAVADLTRTCQDPLARKVKDYLRYRYNFSRNPKRRFAVDCVFSSQAVCYPQADGSVGQRKPAHHQSMKMDCAGGFGSALMVTGTFGFIAAARVIDKLARRAERHSGSD